MTRPPRRPMNDDDDDPYDDGEEDQSRSDDDDDGDNVDLDMLPTMLVYRNGELLYNWVRVDWEAGDSGIEELLARYFSKSLLCYITKLYYLGIISFLVVNLSSAVYPAMRMTVTTTLTGTTLIVMTKSHDLHQIFIHLSAT